MTTRNMVCHELFHLVRLQVAANGHGSIENLFAGLNGAKTKQEFF